MFRQQRVEAIPLPRPSITSTRTLDLHHAHPGRLQVLAEAGAIAAGTLDPDHDVAAHARQPGDELAVSGHRRRHHDLAQQLPQLAQRDRDMLILVGVHPDCDHPYSSSAYTIVEDAAGQSCVERCQASMKSRRHPGYGGGGRQIQTKARLGQLNHESSRRQPHPPQRAGHHRLASHPTQLNHADRVNS